MTRSPGFADLSLGFHGCLCARHCDDGIVFPTFRKGGGSWLSWSRPGQRLERVEGLILKKTCGFSCILLYILLGIKFMNREHEVCQHLTLDTVSMSMCDDLLSSTVFSFCVSLISQSEASPKHTCVSAYSESWGRQKTIDRGHPMTLSVENSRMAGDGTWTSPWTLTVTRTTCCSKSSLKTWILHWIEATNYWPPRWFWLQLLLYTLPADGQAIHSLLRVCMLWPLVPVSRLAFCWSMWKWGSQ